MCDPDNQRKFISVPTGMGKSRIIAAVVVVKHLFARTWDFTIVFTTPLLKQADESIYLHLKTMLKLNLKLVVFNPSI